MSPPMPMFVQSQHHCNQYQARQVKGRSIVPTTAVLLQWSHRCVDGLGLHLDVVPIKLQLVAETLNMGKVNLSQRWFILLLLSLILQCLSANTFGGVAGNTLISFVAY